MNVGAISASLFNSIQQNRRILLRQGSRGQDVRELQQALKAVGLDPGPVDGIFGPKTKAAVRAFQRNHGLSIDGIVGPKTWGALVNVMEARTGGAAANDNNDGVDTGTPPALEPVPTPGGSGVGGASNEPTQTLPTKTLRNGSRGIEVSILQNTLAAHGFSPGPIDGSFGPKTLAAVRAFQRSRGLVADGIVGPRTWAALAGNATTPATPPSTTGAGGATGDYSSYAPGAHFPPHSAAAIALFEEAARLLGVPLWWASAPELHNILSRESNGKVGIPNYTYGAGSNIGTWESIHTELKNGHISARSSATGLGQLLLANVDSYYPDGRAGIGIPLQEAAGMLAYIRSRYGDPRKAWAFYVDPNKPHEGY